MTRPPFDRSDPRDADDGASGADPVARELESYAGLTAGEPPPSLADRVMTALADEPTPRRGFLVGLLGSLEAGRGGGMTRMVLVAGTMVLAVLAVLAAGQLGNLFPEPQIGPSPLPSVVESAPPSVTESPMPSPSQSERPSRSPRPSPSEGSEEPSGSPDDDESETPEPSDDDNSGPGGGGDGDDNSGPGGGGSGSDDDSSGPGSGDDSG